MEIKQFTACKAFITWQNKILILKESNKYQDGTNAGRYDVPGGRVKPDERFDQGLLREIKEETGLEVKLGKPFFVNEWRPIKNDEEWQITGIFFTCQAETEQIILSEDHEEYAWIEPQDFQNYNLIPNLLKAFKAYLQR